MRARLVCVVLAGALGWTGAARAQNAADHFDRGSRAYQQLELGDAARELRRALAVTGADSLPTFAQANALMYLFAAETLRERPDSAGAAARRLLALDPRYRPDALVFPPPILEAFDDLRRATPLVAVRVSGTFDFGSGAALPIALTASTPHHLVVQVTQVGGAPVAEVYAGRIEDDLELRWDGLDSLGAPVPEGRHVLRVTSRDTRGRVAFERRLALDILGERPAGVATGIEARRAVRGAEVAAGALMMRATSHAIGGDRTRSGVGLAVSGGAAIGPLHLRAGYAEASLDAAGGGAERVVVDAQVQAGFQVSPWLGVWVGPRLRALADEPARERWVLWEVRADAAVPLYGDRVRALLGTWGVAAGHADPAGPVSGGWGVEGGIAMRLLDSAVWARLGYRRDQARLAAGARRETVEVLTAVLRVDLARPRH